MLVIVIQFLSACSATTLDIARRSGRSTFAVPGVSLSTKASEAKRSINSTSLKRFYRFWLRNFRTAIVTRPARVIVPEIDHGLAEMLNDVAAIEINVFDQRAA